MLPSVFISPSSFYFFFENKKKYNIAYVVNNDYIITKKNVSFTNIRETLLKLQMMSLKRIH